MSLCRRLRRLPCRDRQQQQRAGVGEPGDAVAQARPDGDGGDVAVRPNRPEQQRFLPHPGVVHGRQRRGQRRAAGLVRPGLPVQRRGLGRQRPEPMGTVPWQRGRRRRVVYAQRHPDHLDRHRGRHLLCHCGRRLRRLPCRDRQQQQRAGVGEPGDAVAQARPDGDGGDVAVRPNRPEQQRFLPHPGVVHGRQRRASAAQPAWYDRVYLSSDAVLDGSDQNLWAPYRGSVVAADGSYTPSATLTTSTGTAVGTYYVIVVADSDGYLAETDNNNNARVSASQVTLSPRPDLTVTAVTLPSAPIGPNSNGSYHIPVSFTVANGGASAAQPAWYDRVYLSSDAVLGRQRPEPMGTVPWQRGRRRRVVYAQRHPDHLDRHRGRHLLCHCGRRLRRLPCRDRQQQQRAGVGEPGDFGQP